MLSKMMPRIRSRKERFHADAVRLPAFAERLEGPAAAESPAAMPYRTELRQHFRRRRPAAGYLAINPTGAVPAIRLDDGRVLAESNAILAFLAEGTPYLPADRFERAKVEQWLSFEGNYVEPAIGTLRHWIMTGKDARRARELVESRRNASLKASAHSRSRARGTAVHRRAMRTRSPTSRCSRIRAARTRRTCR